MLRVAGAGAGRAWWSCPPCLKGLDGWRLLWEWLWLCLGWEVTLLDLVLHLGAALYTAALHTPLQQTPAGREGRVGQSAGKVKPSNRKPFLAAQTAWDSWSRAPCAEHAHCSPQGPRPSREVPSAWGCQTGGLGLSPHPVHWQLWVNPGAADALVLGPWGPMGMLPWGARGQAMIRAACSKVVFLWQPCNEVPGSSSRLWSHVPLGPATPAAHAGRGAGARGRGRGAREHVSVGCEQLGAGEEARGAVSEKCVPFRAGAASSPWSMPAGVGRAWWCSTQDQPHPNPQTHLCLTWP